jgi:hypothetical protein
VWRGVSATMWWRGSDSCVAPWWHGAGRPDAKGARATPCWCLSAFPATGPGSKWRATTEDVSVLLCAEVRGQRQSWEASAACCVVVRRRPSLGWVDRGGNVGLLRQMRAVGFDALGTSPRQIHFGGMAASPLSVTFPVEGGILKLQPCCTWSLGENRVQLLDERRQCHSMS